MKKLDAEMQNSITKAKIIGAGLPIVSGLGALGLWHFGIDISKYAALLLGGANITGLGGALTNYLTEQRNGQANALYYLWKVQNK